MLKKVSLLVLMLLLSLMVACPLGMAMPETIVSVDPKKTEVKVEQTFTIKVNITDVSELRGFDFCLSYDTAILELVEIEEESFLKGVGSTFMINLTTEGLVWLAVVLYHPGGLDISANGSGMLAAITFKAIAEGECLLDLHSKDPYRPDEVKLAKGCKVTPIPNVASDGYVVVSCNSDGCDPDPPSDPPPDPPTEKGPDINGDGRVDVRDVAIVAKAFGSYPGHLLWDSRADLDNDQDVDIQDVSTVTKHFGTSFD